MDNQYVKITKNGVIKSVRKELVAEYVSAGWQVINEPTSAVFPKLNIKQ